MKLTEDDERIFQILIDELGGKEPNWTMEDGKRAHEIFIHFHQLLDHQGKAESYDIKLKGMVSVIKHEQELEQEVKQLKEENVRLQWNVTKLQKDLKYLLGLHNNLKQKLEKMVKEIDENIECYELLNRRHEESYEDSNDNSYLETINRNQEIINHLKPLKDILEETK